jgi:hypothetical protein
MEVNSRAARIDMLKINKLYIKSGNNCYKNLLENSIPIFSSNIIHFLRSLCILFLVELQLLIRNIHKI